MEISRTNKKFLTIDLHFQNFYGYDITYLLWISLHEGEHTVVVVLEVGVEQRGPALVVSAVNGMTTGDQHVNTLNPTREGRKVKRRGQVGILIGACSENHIPIFKISVQQL